MRMETFDVEGLTEKQIELAKQFIELMKRTGEYQEIARDLRDLIQKGVQGNLEISEREVLQIASEAVGFARGRE